MSRPFSTPLDTILRATVAPRDGSRAAARERALPLLASLPAEAGASIHLAAALGDAPAVARLLAEDPARATARGGPFQWDPLTHLCFSTFVEAPDRPARDFAAAARVLLEAGADANTGFDDPKADPGLSWRGVLYAAAALARDLPLTEVLLAHGADPNEEEVAYHTPEGYDTRTLEALVGSGRCSPDTLATMLLRKCDWHDLRGIRWLLGRGADASRDTRWNRSMLHHALSRDNDLEIIQLLLDHGADAERLSDGMTAVAFAARLGRGDVLDAMARRGIALRLSGGDALLAAAARGHLPAVRTIAETHPTALEEVHAAAGWILTRFAGNGNTAGLRALLELGLPVDARDERGFGYYGVAPMSTALHVAAWRGRPAAVRALVAGGADVRARDGEDRTPLQLAVKACVDSHWTDRRTPESVEALLRAGATPDGIVLPTGYDAIDRLLASPREGRPA